MYLYNVLLSSHKNKMKMFVRKEDFIFVVVAILSKSIFEGECSQIKDVAEFSKSLGKKLGEQRQTNLSVDQPTTPKSISVLLNEALLAQIDEATSSWEDDVGFWKVTNPSETRTCILFQAAVQFDITYHQTDGKRYIARIDLPSSAFASGNCDEKSQFINLTWPISLSNSTQVHGSVWIFFVNYYQSGRVTKAPSANTFAVSHIRITYPAANLPGASNPDEMILVENESLDNFSTPYENSYQCEFQELKSTDFTIRFQDFQYQAFMRTAPESSNFSNPLFCERSQEESSPSKQIPTRDILIGLAVAGALLCIVGFIYWNRGDKNDDDDEYDYYED